MLMAAVCCGADRGGPAVHSPHGRGVSLLRHRAQIPPLRDSRRTSRFAQRQPCRKRRLDRRFVAHEHNGSNQRQRPLST
jgi:hypothetical protein